MRRHGDERVGVGTIFPKVQQTMVANSALGGVGEHPAVCGAATEKEWIQFFRRHLPKRYTVGSAYVVGAEGQPSRQIDIAIYDSFYSPALLGCPGRHIPAESVYAVFEVKQEINAELLRDAGEKAASVRELRRTSTPVPWVGGTLPAKEPYRILAGILAVRSSWEKGFAKHVGRVLKGLPPAEGLDLGCALRDGAFEVRQQGDREVVKTSPAEEALGFFFVRLVERLRALGTAPAADLMEYGRSLGSLRE